jgi:hypothetical protein
VVTGTVFALTVLFFRRGVIGTLLAIDLRRGARAQAAEGVPAHRS